MSKLDATRFLSIAVLLTVLAACGEKQHARPSPEFNQTLTDSARRVSRLPDDVEKLECWAKRPVVFSNEVFCNVYFRGRAVKDVGHSAIGWSIPVREIPPFEEDRSISQYALNVPLLARANFLLVANNRPEGLTISVAADQNVLPLSKALEFVDSVLPVISDEMSKKLARARDVAPDSVRATWLNK